MADAMQGWVEAGTCDGLAVVAPILRERRLVWASYGDHWSTHAELFALDALDWHAFPRTPEQRRRPSATSPH